METVLAAAGSSVAQIIKLNVYLTDVSARPIFENVYKNRYRSSPPARTILIVAALNHGYQISIDAIAVTS